MHFLSVCVISYTKEMHLQTEKILLITRKIWFGFIIFTESDEICIGIILSIDSTALKIGIYIYRNVQYYRTAELYWMMDLAYSMTYQ